MQYQVNHIFTGMGGSVVNAFEAIINEKFKDGWKLHSWHFNTDSGTSITYVLEKASTTVITVNPSPQTSKEK